MKAGFSPANNTSQKYLTQYQSLREEAANVDKSDRDTNKEDGYVNFSDKIEITDRAGAAHSKVRQVNSYPITETKVRSDDPLISHTRIEKKVGIVESSSDFISQEKEGKKARDGHTHRVEFVDDGRLLSVKDSNVFMGGEFFLSSMTENFIIDKKTGDIKVLEPTASSL